MPISRTRNRRRAEATDNSTSVVGPAFSRRFLGALAKVAFGSALLAGLGLAGKLGYRWALTSKTFALAQLSFEGLHRASESDLLKLSGLALGANLFQLDARALERSMVSHPWVKKVSVTRHFPSSLQVRVAEHEPVAMVSLGELYLLDDAGEPFKKVQAQDALDLPLVTGVDRDAYVARPDETAAKFQRALRVAKAYLDGGHDRFGALSEVRLDGTAVTLVTGAGQEILLGEGDPVKRLETLPRIRAELKKRRITAEVIHLDNRARPAWVTVSQSVPVSERNGEPTK